MKRLFKIIAAVSLLLCFGILLLWLSSAPWEEAETMQGKTSDLNKAVVLFIGYGSAISPRVDPSPLVQEFGAVRGAELANEVRVLINECNSIEGDWSTQSLVEAGRMAAQQMRSRHPELSDEAIRALEWNYTWDWK